MFNLTILEVIIGLVYLYHIFKLLISFVNKIPSTPFKFHANHLKSAIQNMLDNDPTGKKLYKEFYDYQLIQSFVKKKDKGIPFYIEPKKFGKIIVDISPIEQMAGLEWKKVEYSNTFKNRLSFSYLSKFSGWLITTMANITGCTFPVRFT